MSVHDTQRTKSPSKRALLDRIRDLAAAGVGLAKRKPFLSAGIVAVLVAVVGYNSLSGSEAGRNLILVTAQRGDVENVVTAVGNLQPLNYVDVGAQVSGQLKVLYVAAGDEVTQGDLLAEIDSTIAEAEVEADLAQLRNLNAQLAERQSSLELAAVQASRQERLLAEDATSQDAFDSAQASLRGAEAQVRAVQAQISQSESTLKADEAQLGYSRIFAPLSGTVSSITARQGQTLNANNQTPTILQIADLRVMTVSAQVSEADVQRLYVGMETYFTTLGAPDQRWGGRLRQILPTPTVTNNVVLYTALFDVANPDKQLMTQMTAQVFFVLEAAHDVVTAPAAAIRYAPRTADRSGRPLGAPRDNGDRTRPGGAQFAAAENPNRVNGDFGPRIRGRAATLIVVSASGATETRDVLVGVSDRIRVEIISGLEEGEQVSVGEAVGFERDDNDRRFRGFGGFGGFRGFR